MNPKTNPHSSPLAERLGAWWESYWYEPVDQTRLRYFSRMISATLLLVVWKIDTFVPPHAWAPRSFYQPVWVARTLSIAPPTPTSMAVLRAVLTASLVLAFLAARPDPSAAARRLAAAANAAVLASFSLWCVWAFSWSKVDHDRMTMMVALGALVIVPGVGAGLSRSAGWALRTIQVIFVLAYPLSAVSKIQKTGWDWANQATLARALIRRGTPLGKLVVQHGEFLRFGQWVFFLLELASVLALSRNKKIRAIILPGLLSLHVFAWMTLGIFFWPHTACILAFVPLERLWPPRWRNRAAAELATEPQRA